MKAIVRLIAVSSLLFLAGCQTTPELIDTNTATHGRSTGVVVGEMEPAHFVAIGLTIFQNHEIPLNLPKGQATDAAEDETERLLRLHGWSAKKLISTDSLEDETELQNVLQQARQQALSYVVWIRPLSTSDFVTHSSANLEGVGLYDWTVVKNSGFRVSYAALELSLFDVQTGAEKESAIVGYCMQRSNTVYARNAESITPSTEDEGFLSKTIANAVGNGLWKLGMIDDASLADFDRCDPKHSGTIWEESPAAKKAPADLTDKLGAAINGILMSCSSPYELEQDCSIWSGATRPLIIAGKQLMVAASADGGVILVMLDASMLDASRESVWDPGFAVREISEELAKKGIGIRAIRPVTTVGQALGYVIELDGNGYGVLTAGR